MGTCDFSSWLSILSNSQGAVLLFAVQSEASRPSRRTKLPVPTKETLPYVAEVMGATSYEESIEEESTPAAQQQGRRVQRKLPSDTEANSDVDADQLGYMEYQGVMGRPGVDFPVLPSIPRTEFNCRSFKSSGYYADPDTGCQVFHICDGGRKISFLCPNGTIFRQSHLICDWWFRVDCGKSVEQYEESAELLAHDQMIYKKRAEEIAKAMQQVESRPQEERLQHVDVESVSDRQIVSPKPRNQPRRKPQSRMPTPIPSSTQATRVYSRVENNDNERQILAETASFSHNGQRHRFSNHVSDSNFNRNAYTSDMNKYSTPSPTQPPLQPSTTSKPVFTIHVKPNREFSFVELHRQDTKNKAVQQKPDPYSSVQFVTSRPANYNSHTTVNQTPSPVSRVPFTTEKVVKYSAKTTQGQKNSHSTPYYSLPPDFTLATTELPPYFSPFNDTDFIRPEAINSLMDSDHNTNFPKFGTPTPASAVNTLHSLASYYESAAADIQKELSNLDLSAERNSKPAVSEILLRAHSGSPDPSHEFDEVLTTVKPEAVDASNYTVLPSVLTKATQDSYSFLFKDKPNKNGLNSNEFIDSKSEEITSETKTNDIGENVNIKQIENKINEEKELMKKQYYKETQQLKESTDLRELAQVFTRALSAYLEDPESFKEILAQVRPTEPNSKETTTPSPDDEVLAFSDDNKEKIGDLPTFDPQSVNDVSPGDINNLATALKHVETDNSIELASSGSIEHFDRSNYLTTENPTSIAQDVNSFVSNNTYNNIASGEYYSSLGSSEDKTYFPTAGGVSDDTRPRYGGFQNNSGDYRNDRNVGKKYSPYGAELPPNITGAPLSELPTTSIPLTTGSYYNNERQDYQNPYQSIPEKLNLPEAYDVNNLASGGNNFFTEASSQYLGSSEEANIDLQKQSSIQKNEPSFSQQGDQERLLVASGTQSFVSANNNYLNYNGQKHPEQKKENNYYHSLYSPFSYNHQTGSLPIDTPLSHEESKSINNQAVTFDVESTTYPTTTVYGDFILPEQTTSYEGLFERINDHQAEKYTTTDVNYEQYTTEAYNYQNYDNHPTDGTHLQNVNLGNGVTLERTIKFTRPNPEVSWTLPSVTEKSQESEHKAFIRPTTYHPQHKNEFASATDHPLFIPPEPQFEEKAKEMFGSLNETAAGKLMKMMDKAEKNTTIRKLVLLLVSDANKENLTVEESRSNLIQALLTSEEPTRNPTEAPPPSTLPPNVEMKQERMQYSVSSSNEKYRSGKSYRGTDSLTGVHGSQNRLESAKLFIPPGGDKAPYDSDARAVELLKSLYNLAAKWG